ncbi:hypothetical protein LX36DRAFT_712077 [Colletotrichum falcatum]|nr:hypothetical protein LX36DRAFT_712077 [Colletotrichum falcatum]
MRALTSLLAAAVLAAAPAAAGGFSQEYNIIADGVPCAARPDGSFACVDGKTKATVFVYNTTDGYLGIEDQTAAVGVRVQCGGPEAFTLFAEPGSPATYQVEPCVGKNMTSAATVRAGNPFKVPLRGQELTFTDADPCARNSDGVFSCGGRAAIWASTGQIVMQLDEGAGDTAIRVSCAAGSSVFFAGGGARGGLFDSPSVCGDGITEAVNARSRRLIDDPWSAQG